MLQDARSVTEQSIDEVSFRLLSAADAFMHSAVLARDPLCYQCSEYPTETGREEYDESLRQSLVSITFQYGIVQLNTVFDHQGDYALHLQEKKDSTKPRTKKYIVRKTRLRQLLPAYSEDQLNIIHRSLNSTLKDYRYEVFALRRARNKLIAHSVHRRVINIERWENYDLHHCNFPLRLRRPFRLFHLCHDLLNGIRSYW